MSLWVCCIGTFLNRCIVISEDAYYEEKLLIDSCYLFTPLSKDTLRPTTLLQDSVFVISLSKTLHYTLFARLLNKAYFLDRIDKTDAESLRIVPWAKISVRNTLSSNPPLPFPIILRDSLNTVGRPELILRFEGINDTLRVRIKIQ